MQHPDFTGSNALRPRFHARIPGGAHTYAKDDDQYPEGMAPYLVRGAGAHVWDVDGNEFIEYGSGLRSVGLGHAHPAVVAAAREALDGGCNFIRPHPIELEAAELLLSLVAGDMVKFAKHGSDATTGAVKLARAHTGRDLVAVCADQPFFAVNDWFIGSSHMPAGVPKHTREATLTFPYNDLDALRELFEDNPGEIAAIVMEAEKETPPAEGYFDGVRRLCDQHGVVFVLDEIITGFRWHNGGARAFHGIEPDLVAFGKALANGFSVSALTGRRELMERGGADHDRERVFLMSTTHGGEVHQLAAAIATMQVYRDEPVVETIWSRGERLAAGLREVTAAHGVDEFVPISGRPCALVFGTLDAQRQRSQPFRTLLMQELIDRGVLATSLVTSYAHTVEDIDRTIEAFDGALAVYRKALDDGIERYLRGRSVQPAIRPRR